MTISAILRDKTGAGGGQIVTLAPDMTVAGAVAIFTERRIGAAPVMAESGGTLGIFSERDVIRCLHARGPAALDAPVAEVMTTPAISVTPDQPVIAALSLMTRRRIRHLPRGRRRSTGRLRLDRRSGEAADRPDRGRGGGDAGLYCRQLTLRTDGKATRISETPQPIDSRR